MSGYQRRLDRAIEQQSGATAKQADQFAIEAEQARLAEERKKKRDAEAKKKDQGQYWSDALKRMFGV